MLSNIPFHWHNILPISYENFLSQTEVLECVKDKINSIIFELNTFENDFNNNVKKISNSVIKKYFNEIENDFKEVLKSVSELQKEVEASAKSLNDFSTYTSKKINTLENTDEKIYSQIDKINSTINDIFSFVDSLEKKLDNEALNTSTRFTKVYNYIDLKNRVLLSSFMIKLKKMYDDFKKIVIDIPNHIEVLNPINNRVEPIEKVLNDIFYWQYGLSAEEFRRLGLTCEEFTRLNLTSLEFRLYGISLVKKEKMISFFDLHGNVTENPTSSVFDLLGFNEKVDSFELSNEEINAFMAERNTFEMDKYSLLIFSNHFNAKRDRNVAVISDSFTLESNGEATQIFSIPLHIPIDYGELPIDDLKRFGFKEGIEKTLLISQPQIDFIDNDPRNYFIQFVGAFWENEQLVYRVILHDFENVSRNVAIIDLQGQVTLLD